jgi:hypothetical protein
MNLWTLNIFFCILCRMLFFFARNFIMKICKVRFLLLVKVWAVLMSVSTKTESLKQIIQGAVIPNSVLLLFEQRTHRK